MPFLPRLISSSARKSNHTWRSLHARRPAICSLTTIKSSQFSREFLVNKAQFERVRSIKKPHAWINRKGEAINMQGEYFSSRGSNFQPKVRFRLPLRPRWEVLWPKLRWMRLAGVDATCLIMHVTGPTCWSRYMRYHPL